MALSALARCMPIRPATPLPRRGLAGWAIGTVAFFAAVAVLPKAWAGTASVVLPVVVAVAVTAPGHGRRVERWLTAPYVLLGLVAMVLDVVLFPHGSVPALLAGLVPAGGGLLSWSRPRTGRPGSEGGTR
jgi:hypothetical protein